MKNRMNVRLAIFGVIATVLTAAIVVPLVAQPEPPISPYPGPKVKAVDLIVPPGVYSSFVFTYSAKGGEDSAQVVLKTVSGNLTLMVPPDESIVIPMGTNFTLGQQGTIVVPSGVGVVSVAGITPSGPVTFEAAKK